MAEILERYIIDYMLEGGFADGILSILATRNAYKLHVWLVLKAMKQLLESVRENKKLTLKVILAKPMQSCIGRLTHLSRFPNIKGLAVKFR